MMPSSAASWAWTSCAAAATAGSSTVASPSAVMSSSRLGCPPANSSSMIAKARDDSASGESNPPVDSRPGTLPATAPAPTMSRSDTARTKRRRRTMN